MRITTFNIQHCHHYPTGKINIPLFADKIRGLSADICGLNEVRGRGALAGYTDQIGELSVILGCEKYFGRTIKVGGVGPYGNGLLTRYDIISAEVIHIPDTDDRSEKSNYEHRGFINARLDAEGRELAVLVCHMGLSAAEQKCAVDALVPVIDKTECPLVLMGDFNTAPDSGVLTPIFDRMSDTDAVSVNPGQHTFPSYKPDVKIDYIFYRNLVCTRAETVTQVVSDHFPIMADFEFVNG